MLVAVSVCATGLAETAGFTPALISVQSTFCGAAGYSTQPNVTAQFQFTTYIQSQPNSAPQQDAVLTGNCTVLPTGIQKCTTQTPTPVSGCPSLPNSSGDTSAWNPTFLALTIPNFATFNTANASNILSFSVAGTDSQGNPVMCPTKPQTFNWAYLDWGGEEQGVGVNSPDASNSNQADMGTYVWVPDPTDPNITQQNHTSTAIGTTTGNFDLVDYNQIYQPNNVDNGTCVNGVATTNGVGDHNQQIWFSASGAVLARTLYDRRTLIGFPAQSLKSLTYLSGDYVGFRYSTTGTYQVPVVYAHGDGTGKITGCSLSNPGDITSCISGSNFTMYLDTPDFPFQGGVTGSYMGPQGASNIAEAPENVLGFVTLNAGGSGRDVLLISHQMVAPNPLNSSQTVVVPENIILTTMVQNVLPPCTASGSGIQEMNFSLAGGAGCSQQVYVVTNAGEVDATNLTGSIQNATGSSAVFGFNGTGQFPGTRSTGVPVYPPCGTTLPAGSQTRPSRCEVVLSYCPEDQNDNPIYGCQTGMLTVSYQAYGNTSTSTVPLKGTNGVISLEPQTTVTSTLYKEQKLPLNPIATLADGTTADVSDCMRCYSSNNTIATIDQSGTVLGVQSGNSVALTCYIPEASSNEDNVINNCPGAALLTITPQTTSNFGNVALNQSSTLTFNVTNTGQADATSLSLSSFKFGNTQFTVTSTTCSGTLSPSLSCTVTGTFTPTQAGTFPTTLTASYNNSYTTTTASLQVTGAGTGPASLTITPVSTNNFGTVAVGSYTTRQFIVTNTGSTNATGVSFSFDNAVFSIETSLSTCGAVLTSGSNCLLTVIFQPTAAASDGGTLTASYNNGTSNTASTEPVSGMGAGQAYVTIAPVSTGDYGAVVVGLSKQLEFVVTNTGTATATNLVLSLDNSEYSQVQTSCTTTLAPGADCFITAQFAPTQTGPAIADLKATYQDGTSADPSSTTSLSGTGIAAITCEPQVPVIIATGFGSPGVHGESLPAGFYVNEVRGGSADCQGDQPTTCLGVQLLAARFTSSDQAAAQAPYLVVTDYYVSPPGQHLPLGPLNCPIGYSYLNSLVDCDTSECSGDQIICAKYAPIQPNMTVVSDVYVTAAGVHNYVTPPPDGCQPGYQEVGSWTDCNNSTSDPNNQFCQGTQEVCVAKSVTPETLVSCGAPAPIPQPANNWPGGGWNGPKLCDSKSSPPPANLCTQACAACMQGATFRGDSNLVAHSYCTGTSIDPSCKPPLCTNGPYDNTPGQPMCIQGECSQYDADNSNNPPADTNGCPYPCSECMRGYIAENYPTSYARTQCVNNGQCLQTQCQPDAPDSVVWFDSYVGPNCTVGCAHCVANELQYGGSINSAVAVCATTFGSQQPQCQVGECNSFGPMPKPGSLNYCGFLVAGGKQRPLSNLGVACDDPFNWGFCSDQILIPGLNPSGAVGGAAFVANFNVLQGPACPVVMQNPNITFSQNLTVARGGNNGTPALPIVLGPSATVPVGSNNLPNCPPPGIATAENGNWGKAMKSWARNELPVEVTDPLTHTSVSLKEPLHEGQTIAIGLSPLLFGEDNALVGEDEAYADTINLQPCVPFAPNFFLQNNQDSAGNPILQVDTKTGQITVLNANLGGVVTVVVQFNGVTKTLHISVAPENGYLAFYANSGSGTLIDFGNVTTGSCYTNPQTGGAYQQIIVKNTQPGPVTFCAPDGSTCANGAASVAPPGFSFAPTTFTGPVSSNGGECGPQLPAAPNQNSPTYCYVQVGFCPPNAGSYNDFVTINYNTGSQILPFPINVVGQAGLQSVTIQRRDGLTSTNPPFELPAASVGDNSTTTAGFNAIATFKNADGSTFTDDITKNVSFFSTNTLVAAFNPQVYGQGVLQLKRGGSITVSAAGGYNPVSQTYDFLAQMPVTINASTLLELTVTGYGGVGMTDTPTYNAVGQFTTAASSPCGQNSCILNGLPGLVFSVTNGIDPQGLGAATINPSTGALRPVHGGTIHVTATYTDPNFPDYTLTNTQTIQILQGPLVTQVLPTVALPNGQVDATGDTTINILGFRFTPTSTVTVLGQPCATVTYISSNQLNCSLSPYTPTGQDGISIGDVVVTNPDGSSYDFPSSFRYAVAPTITSFSPTSGSTNGGTTVTINGTNFQNPVTGTGNPSVTIGNYLCSVTSATQTQITCTTAPIVEASQSSSLVVYNYPNDNLAVSAIASTQFTYSGPPKIAYITPAASGTSGGNTIDIYGSQFAQGATVTIGGTAATNVNVISSTHIQVTAPAGSAGTVNVVVTNPDNSTVTDTNAFSYELAPSITSVSPAEAPQTIPTTVTITGQNFYPGATVTTGSDPGYNVTVSADGTTITFQTKYNAATVGPATVTVTNPSGQTATSSAFTIVGAPVITGATPYGGLPAGGNTITINGSNFANATAVKIGGVACTSFTVAGNGNSITCTVPANTTGPAQINVTTTPGPQAGQLDNAYYYESAPTITSISPHAYGTTAGGQTLYLYGTNLRQGANITFGGQPATNVDVDISGTSLSLVTPPYTGTLTNGSAAVNVVYTDPANPSTLTTTLTNGFTYHAPPTITSLTPTAGAPVGGYTVTLNGTYFHNTTPPPVVLFGSNSCTNVTVGGSLSSSTITCTAPSAPQNAAGSYINGPVNVTVTNSDDNLAATLSNGFSFSANPNISALSPTSLPETVASQLKILGTNFLSGDTVTVNGQSATNVQVDAAGDTITCTVPAITTATASNTTPSVVVSYAATGASATDSTDLTWVAPPTITGVSPGNGYPTGGTSVTITGTNFTNVTGVQFGGVNAASYTVNSATQITATSPVHSAGVVSLTVSTSPGPQVATSSFNYSAAPTITQVTPTVGPMAGGNTLTLTGSNYTSGSGQTVTVGGNNCPIVSVTNGGTTLTCTIPKGNVNDGTAVDIVYNDPTNAFQQTVTLSAAYTYHYPPSISSLSPNEGPMAGGNTVTILGSYLRPGPTVTFGTAQATNVTYINSTEITAVAPSVSSPQNVTVTVTNTDGLSGTSTYGYSPPPTVTGVVPNSATLAGNIQVQINGTNMRTGAAATIGGVACASPTVDASQLFMKCTAPAAPGGAAGSYDVVVSNNDTGSNPNSGTLHNGFTYQAAPTISSISPASGPQGGGTGVTITGTNLDAGTNVTFGGVAGLSPSVNAAQTQLTVTTPSMQSAGAVNVVVTQSSGQSVTQTNGFTFVAPPTLTSVSPTVGPTTGATTLSLKGTNFTSPLTVTLGSTACGSVTITDASDATCVTPSLSAGTMNVTVSTSPGPQSATLNNAFTAVAVPAITSISPTTGPTAGGATLVVSGTNFSTATGSITVGGNACTITQASSTSITCTTPAGSAGAANVVYSDSRNPTQLTVTDSSAYTYSGAPSLTAINPTQGGNNGQTLVTLTGANFVQGSTTVTIGSAACTSVNVISESQLTCITGSSANGTYTVTVTTGGGSVNLSNAYTYVTPATVCDTGTDMNAGDTCTVSSTVTLANNSAIAGAGNLEIKSGGSITCTAPCSLSYQIGGSMTVDSGGNTNSAISSLSANSLSVSGTMTGDITAANVPTVTVNSGGTIKGNLYNFQATSFTVASGGTVSADGLGYAASSSRNPGAGPGAGPFPGGSASHGGAGGAESNGDGPSTVLYGSVTFPNEWGSSGGWESWPDGVSGGNGGGIIWLIVSNTLTVNGVVSANGLSPASGSAPGGAGAGGSILIDLTNALHGGGGTGQIAGAGNINAQGGAGLIGAECCDPNSGGGGGGRIAFYSSNKFQGNFSVAGGGVATPSNTQDNHGPGHPGAGGSFYQSITNGLCDSGDLNGTDTCTISSVTAVGQNQGFPASGGAQLGASIVVSPTGYLYTPGNGYGLNINTTGNVTLQSRSTAGVAASLGNATITAGNVTVGAGSSLNAGTGLSATVASGGTFEVDGTVNGNITSLSAPTVTLNGTINGSLSNFNATTVTMNSGSAINGNVNWLNATNLTIASGATISATGQGYNWPNYGPGSGGYGVSAAHGGAGGNAAGNGNNLAGSTNTYGSLTWPTELGSGGNGNGYIDGAAGGGFVGIEISGALTLNGTIAADGLSSNTLFYNWSGAGAGGSVIVNLITPRGTATLSGSGLLSAKGGNGYGQLYNNYYTGGGGGGRIAWYGPTFGGTINVRGGTGYSGSNPLATSTPGLPGTYYASTSPAALSIAGPTSLSAGTCSALYTVTTQDGLGNTVSINSSATIDLSGGHAAFYSDSGCTQAIQNVSLASGQSQASFYVKDTTAESLSVTAAFDTAKSTQGTLAASVAAGPATKLAITGPTTPTDTTCVAYTVSAVDAYGNPVVLSSQDVVNLTASANAKLYSNSGCTSSTTSVTIASGSSSQTFYVDDTTAQNATLTATDNAGVLSQASDTPLFSPGPITQIVVTGPASVYAGSCTPYTVTAEDAAGNASAPSSALQIAVSDQGNGFFYSDSGCATAKSSYTLGTGSSSFVVYFKDIVAESISVGAQDSLALYTKTSEAVTVNAALASALAIAGPPALVAGSCSGYTVTSQDGYGNPSNLSTSTFISLSGNGSGTYYTDSGCTTPASGGVSIAANASSAAFYFKDATIENLTLKASAGAGLSSGTLAVQNRAGLPTKLLVTGPSSVGPGQCGLYTVTSKDANNNASAPAQTTVLTLAGGSASFFADAACSNGYPSYPVALSSSSSSVTFALKDMSAETLTLLVSGGGLTPGALSVTIAVAPVLNSVPNYTYLADPLVQGVPFTVDFNNVQGGSPGNDVGMTYTCVFDQIIDGTVNPGTSCAQLPGTPVTFNTSTGVLSWTPSSSALGPFEIKVTGTSGGASASQIFAVDVRPPYPIANLIANYDVAFENTTGPLTSGSSSTWTDLSGNGNNAALSGAAASSGFTGSGTAASPYAVSFNGTDNATAPTSMLSGESGLLVTSWVNPASGNAAGSVMWGNSSNGQGVALRKALTYTGNMELVAGTPYQDTVLALSPAAYWRLDECGPSTALDISGNNVSGTYANGTSCQSALLTGDNDGATGFNGSSSQVTANINISTTSSYTTTAWFNYTGSTSCSNCFKQVIDSRAGSAITPARMVAVTEPSADSSWPLSFICAIEVPNSGYYTAPIQLNPNQTYFGACTYNASTRTLTPYVNGVAGTSLTVPSGSDASSTAIAIGKDGDLSIEYFQGTIDEVAIFNSVLSASQIANLYNAGTGQTGASCLGATAPATGAWNFFAGAYGSNGLTLFYNGRSDCTVKAPPGLAASGSAFTAASTPSNTKNVTTQISDLKVYGTTNGTVPASGKAVFDATADRYRATPAAGIVTNGIVLNLDAANYKNGILFGGTGCALTSWFDLSPYGTNGALANFSGCSSDGWQGAGTPSSPYVLSFNGSGDYVNLPAWPGADWANGMTVEVWAYPTAANSWARFIDMGNGSPSDTVMLARNGTGTTVRWQTCQASNCDVIDTGNMLPNLNTWYHIVGTVDGSGNANVYENGALVNSGTLLVPRNVVRNQAWIGRSEWGDPYYAGSMAVVRMYNRSLAAWEVSQNCNALASRFSGVSCAYVAPPAGMNGLSVASTGAAQGGCGAISVTALLNGASYAVPVDTAVGLSSTGSGKFYANSSCSGNAVTTAVIPQGSSSGTIYFEDPAAETVSVSASAEGVTSAAVSVTSYSTATAKPPVLSAVSNYTFPLAEMTQGEPLSVTVTNVAYGQPGFNTGMSYTCAFDQLPGSGSTPSTPCSQLPSFPPATMNSTTGAFSFTPSTTAFGAYRIQITGANSNGSASVTFVVDVRPAYPLASLVGDYDADFATLTAPVLSGTPSTWFDLSAHSFNGSLFGTAPNKWTGSAPSGTSPYALTFDGAGQMTTAASQLSSATKALFDTWINPSSVSTGGAVILSDGGGSGAGFVLKQSASAGRLELDIGNVSYPNVVEAFSPVGYWRLTESSGSTATDSSTSGDNGTYQGAVTLGAAGPPVASPDTSVTFSGTEYVSLPGTNLPVDYSSYAISAWVKPTAMGNYGITGWGYYGNNNSVNALRLSSTGVVNYWWGNDFSVTTNNLADGNWHHLVAQWDGTTRSIYVDGTLAGSQAASGLSAAPANFTLGAANTSAGEYFSGSLAQVAIFNKALSADQIRSLYYGGLCVSSGTVSNGNWYNVAGLYDGTNATLFINGSQSCSVPAAGLAFSPPASALSIGSAPNASSYWKGEAADLKVYATSNGSSPGTGTTVASIYNAELDRYRTAPTGAIRNGLVLNLDAADYANGGMAFGGTGCANTTWLDLSSYAANGFLTGFSGCSTDGWTGTGTGSSPYALTFNGSSDYVSLGSWPGANWANGMTVEVWAYPTSAANWARFVDMGNGNPSDTILLARNGTSNAVRWQTCQGGTCASFDTANALPSLNTWYHLVATVDASGTGYLYENGTLLNSGQLLIPNNVTRNQAWIGKSEWQSCCGDSLYQGQMAVVRMYNRALANWEVSENCVALQNRFPGVSCNVVTPPGAAAFTELSFTGAQGSLVNGCGSYTVTAMNGTVPATVTSDTQVGLGGTGAGAFYASSSCTGPTINSVVIPAGQSSVTVYYSDPTAQTVSLSASTNDVGPASIQVTEDGAASPVLASAPGYTVADNTALYPGDNFSFDFSNVAYGLPGVTTGMSYTCFFDQVVDGVVGTGNPCTNLPGYPATTFNTSTGLLEWTPDWSAYGPYELKITGIDSYGSASEIVVMDVRAGYSKTNLLGDWDASMANGVDNNTSGSTWVDLTGNGYSGTTSDAVHAAWTGNGSAANPFAVTFDGSGNVNFGGSVLSAATQVLFQAWIKPAAVTTAGSIVLTDGGESGVGFALRQAKNQSGELELFTNNAPNTLSSYNAAITALNPVGWWRLSETSGTTATDSSGNNDNGTYTNVTLGAPGSLGDTTGAYFNGSSSYVSIQGSAANTVGTVPYTVVAWFRTNSYGPIVGNSGGCGGCSSGSYNNILYVGTDGMLRGGIWASGNNDASAQPVNDGLWHQAVFVGTSTSQTGYLDGNQVFSNTQSGSGSNSYFNIGANYASSWNYTSNGYFFFNGNIDQVAVFNQALTQPQIQSLYNAGSSCVSEPLTNNLWTFVAGLFDGTNESLFVNGKKQCQLPAAASTFSPPSTALSAGATASKTSGFSGEIAMAEAYGTANGSSVGSAAEVAQNYEATADRFRSVPAGSIVTGNLALDLDPANAWGGVAFPGTGCSIAQWLDMSAGGNNANIISCLSGYGFQGNGTGTNPYRWAIGGASEAVTVPISSTLQPTAVTVSAWVRVNGPTTSTTCGSAPNTLGYIVFMRNAACCNFEGYSLIYNAGDNFSFTVTDANNNTNTVNTPNNSTHYGQWYNVTATFQQPNAAIYLNGALAGTGTHNYPLSYGTHPLSIGRSNECGQSGYSNYDAVLNGDIGGVMVYDTVLTPSQIQQNCQAQASRFGATCSQ